MDTRAPSPTIKLLMIVLGNFAHAKDPWCFPSQQTISEDSGLSERAIRDNLKAMEVAGLIRRVERRRKDGSKTSDLIHLLFMPQPAAGAGSSPADDRKGHRQMAPSSPAAGAGHEKEEEQGEEQGAQERDLLGGEVLGEAPVQKAIRLYNELATRLPNAAKAEELTKARQSAIKARMCGAKVDRWQAALNAVEHNRFLAGEVEGQRGRFRLTLEFITRPANFQKLIEGGYDRDRDPPKAEIEIDAWPMERWERVFARYNHSNVWPDYAGPRPGEPGCLAPAQMQGARR